jgi:hypothetical protein
LHLFTWIDANAPYHDGFINKRAEQPQYNLPADQELIRKLTAVHIRRCSSCHQPEDVSRAEWIDIHQPQKSLFLSASLAKEAGGAQKCTDPVYEDPGDPDYQAVLQLVESAVARAWENPRRDLLALIK